MVLLGLLVSSLVLLGYAFGATSLYQLAGFASRLLTHLAPKTYQKLLWLNAQWKKPEVQAFLHEELLFTNADALAIGTNLAAAVATLQKSCTAGTLWLDIDLKEHLGAGLPQQTKDRCAPKAEP